MQMDDFVLRQIATDLMMARNFLHNLFYKKIETALYTPMPNDVL